MLKGRGTGIERERERERERGILKIVGRPMTKPGITIKLVFI